jgi:hypothetical protein
MKSVMRHDLYSSPRGGLEIKPRIRWAGHVAHVGELHTGLWCGNLREKDGKILKRVLTRLGGRRLDQSGNGKGQAAGSCERGNKPSGFMKEGLPEIATRLLGRPTCNPVAIPTLSRALIHKYMHKIQNHMRTCGRSITQDDVRIAYYCPEQLFLFTLAFASPKNSSPTMTLFHNCISPAANNANRKFVVICGYRKWLVDDSLTALLAAGSTGQPKQNTCTN